MEAFTDVGFILNTFLFLFSGILVMWMAAGFAMLEAGLTRTKNTATILTKNIMLFAVAGIMYYVIGYPIMYGGGIEHYLMNGLATAADAKYSLWSDFFFQMMFVATAASVISGTVAERMKLVPFLAFTVLLAGVIYPIVGLATWGGTNFFGYMEGFSDFAGSTIVHSVGGWAALAAVLVLGARKGKYSKDGGVKAIPGSNLTAATLGAMILFMGWFGFNGGSVLAMDSVANVSSISLVMVSTAMGAFGGAIASALTTMIIWKKMDLTMVLNGLLAGLVAVTAGPDIGVGVAIIEGLIAGVLVVGSILFIDKKLKIDDPVGALSVHLVAGIWGTLAVGIFGSAAFLTQLIGVVVIGAFVFIVSLVVWYILNKTVGIRVSEEVEYEGLDIHETGLEAYPEFTMIKGA